MGAFGTPVNSKMNAQSRAGEFIWQQASRSFLGSLGQLFIAFGNIQHHVSGFPIAHLNRHRARFLCSIAPMLRVGCDGCARVWHYAASSLGADGSPGVPLPATALVLLQSILLKKCS